MCDLSGCKFIQIIEGTTGEKLYMHYAQDIAGNFILIRRDGTAFENGCKKFLQGINKKKGKTEQEEILLDYDYIFTE
jgi:hypothetical protein